MLSTTPSQLKKLERLAKVLDNGDIALLTELDTLESRLEGLERQLPALREAKDGEKGKQGEKGEKGDKGDSIKGERGDKGDAGKDGTNGKDGINGLNGIDGKDGADGFIDVATIAYLEDEIKRVEEKIPEIVKQKETNFGFVIRDVVAGTGVTIDKSDPNRPIVNAEGVAPTIKDTFGITVDGAGIALTTGTKGFRYIEQDCTITGWSVVSDVSGSIIFDVKRSGASLAGTEKPTLSATSSASDLSLSTWTTSLVAGDIIEFIIDSASTVTRATLTVLITKI